MGENSELRPISEMPVANSRYYNPCLIKDGTLSRLYRVTRDGKYFIIKTSKDGSGMMQSLVRREYELSIGLSHPNIVNLFTYEYDTPVGEGIVMEYIDGCSLNEFLSKNPSMKLRRKVLEQLFAAVAYLHDKGVIHNDLKPENIMLRQSDNTLKIIDFGLSENDAFFLTKHLGCTPEYASPELKKGENVDCRSDIYSLGLLAKDILRGRCVHMWKTATHVNKAKRYETVAQMEKALYRGRNLLLVLGIVALISLLVLSFSIRTADSITIIDYDTQRRSFVDSVCSDIDKQLEKLFIPAIEDLQECAYIEDCLDVINSIGERMKQIQSSFENSTSDREQLAIIGSYFDSQLEYYNSQYRELLLSKPARLGNF